MFVLMIIYNANVEVFKKQSVIQTSISQFLNLHSSRDLKHVEHEVI